MTFRNPVIAPKGGPPQVFLPWTQYFNQLDNVLFSKDTFFDGSGFPLENYDWPTPPGHWVTGKGYFPVQLRSWTYSYSLELVGKDLFFGNFGQPVANLDWPTPPAHWVTGKGYFDISLRNWVDSFPLELIGKDQFFGAPGQPPANLDWPNPQGHTVLKNYPVSLRTWIVPFALLFPRFLSLATTAIAQAKGLITPGGTANLKASSNEMAKGTVTFSGTAALAARVQETAKGSAPVVPTLPLRAAGEAMAKTVGAIGGAVKIVAQSIAQAKATDAFSGVAAMFARGAGMSTKESAPIGFFTFLSTLSRGMAKASNATTVKLAMTVTSAAMAKATDAISGAVSIAAAGKGMATTVAHKSLFTSIVAVTKAMGKTVAIFSGSVPIKATGKAIATTRSAATGMASFVVNSMGVAASRAAAHGNTLLSVVSKGVTSGRNAATGVVRLVAVSKSMGKTVFFLSSIAVFVQIAATGFGRASGRTLGRLLGATFARPVRGSSLLGGTPFADILDSLNIGSGMVLSAHGFVATYQGTDDTYTNVRSVANFSTGRFYCEFTLNTEGSTGQVGGGIGVTAALTDQAGGGWIGSTANSVGFFSDNDGTIWINGASQNSNPSPTWKATGGSNILQMAVDIGAKLIWFNVNNTGWYGSGTIGSGNPATGTAGFNFSSSGPGGALASGNVYAYATLFNDGDQIAFNFGQFPYAFTPPSGFGNWMLSGGSNVVGIGRANNIFGDTD